MLKCGRCGTFAKESPMIPDKLVIFRCACMISAATTKEILFSKYVDTDAYFVVEIEGLKFVSGPFRS